VEKPKQYAAATVKLHAGNHNSEERNKKIKQAQQAEIKQVFEELDALEPVKKEQVPQGIKVLGSHLFTMEIYPDRSLPTVSVHVIMTCLAIAACNMLYTLGRINVKGAFIQTEMSGMPVYIKLTGKVSEAILKMYPHLAEFMGGDRILYCKLKKALYGCVKASKLWYEQLRKFLQMQGYERCEMDPCVFKRVAAGKVYLLLIYIVADTGEFKRLERERVCWHFQMDYFVSRRQSFLRTFKWITLSVGDSHSYIGMQISVRNGIVTLDMRYYLGKILECCEKPRVATVTPR